jgi:hypothetical protein
MGNAQHRIHISELVDKGYIIRYKEPNKNRTIYVKRKKFEIDKSNEVISDGDNHSDNSLHREEDNNQMQSKSSSNGPDNHPEGLSATKDDWQDISTILK